MASTSSGAVVREMQRLFALDAGGGTAAGLSEAQLLERFLTNRDQAAFEALVVRFGPMVLGVCRGLINDPHLVDDAFQATFLVLVRKGGSIRDKDLFGNWLYGVAYRVAKRARADNAKRQRRERGGIDVAAQPTRESAAVDELDLAPIIHEELGRLPNNYRQAVVLCDLDGQTHEQAARLLKWPLGTVKGRLFRARELLRKRLSRRGVAAPVAGFAAVVGREVQASVPAQLLESTVRTALASSAGAVAAGAVSLSAAHLAQGVINAMFLSKLKLITAGVVSLAVVATSTGAFVRMQDGSTDDPVADRAPNNAQADVQKQHEKPKADTVKVSTVDGDPTIKGGREPGEDPRFVPASNRLDAAKQFFESTKAYHEIGQTTIDRVIDASRRWKDAEQAAAKSEAARTAALEHHVQRIAELAKRENARFEVGSSSLPNAAEANLALVEAKDALANKPSESEKGPKNAVAAAAPNPDGSADVEDPEDETRNQLIQKLLNKRIPMPFHDETALEDVLKYIRENTIDAENFPEGIPIYVDPIALQEAEKTITSTIRLNLSGVRLRTTLKLLLAQLDLRFAVREGLIIIEAIPPPPAPPPDPNRPKGFQ